MSDQDEIKDTRPYVVRTYDRWIILVLVLVVGWLLFRPVFSVVTAYRGVTFEAMLIPDTAEHYYKKAIAIDPAIPDGWIHLGELYYSFSFDSRMRYELAAQTFTEGEKAVPNNARLPFDLGRTYLIKLHDYKKAEDALRIAVQRDPSMEFGWDYLAYAALKNGDRQYAVECWRKVLQINPNHDSARRAIERYGS
ncbi:MAG TPA: tetratricopeptide repeat protein [Candidatus Eremiobacteraceae bacterium]|nr:tetratricopeptide repeat protein [Candidatus Eremiobacteraceae bacterium]